MKKNIVRLFFTAVLYTLLFANQGLAQRGYYAILNYQVSVPMGDTKDFISDPSYSGFGLEFRYVTQPNMTVGGRFGWNIFHERTEETLQIENGAVTGVQDRYLNSFPIMLNAHYYFGDRGSTARPFVGLSAGGFYMVQRFGIGVIEVNDDRWEWGFAPEVGAVFAIDYNYGIILNAKYNYAFTGETFGNTDFRHSYVEFGVGLVWGQ